MTSNNIMLDLSALIDMAASYWTLQKWAKGQNYEELPHVLRRYMRKCDDFYHRNNIEMLDLTNQTYDAGLSVEVIHKQSEGCGLAEGQEVICEMVAPVILYNGAIVKRGQVVIR